jgi:hypothetical protein
MLLAVGIIAPIVLLVGWTDDLLDGWIENRLPRYSAWKPFPRDIPRPFTWGLMLIRPVDRLASTAERLKEVE